MQAWQAQIEDEQIEFLAGEQGGFGFASGTDMIDRSAGCAQAAHQPVGQYMVIFRDQDPHAFHSPYGPMRAQCLYPAL